MLGKQRRDVLALAARTAQARERGRLASSALNRAASGFTPRPAMLVLPFAVGVASTLIATGHARGRSSTDRRLPDARRDALAWGSIASNALTLWNTARPLRNAMRDPRNRDLWRNLLADLPARLQARAAGVERPGVGQTSVDGKPSTRSSHPAANACPATGDRPPGSDRRAPPPA